MSIAGRLLVALTGVFLAGVGISATGEPLVRAAESANLGCKLPGLRYFGAAPAKAKVCFTLTANRKSMREYRLQVCASAEAKLTAGDPRYLRNVALSANGRFSTRTGFLLASFPPIPVNVTFSGRVQGSRASGSILVDPADPLDPVDSFRCAWTAHRVG